MYYTHMHVYVYVRDWPITDSWFFQRHEMLQSVFIRVVNLVTGMHAKVYHAFAL